MICSRYKSMGVKIVLPSSSASSKSMSSSLSESDSMSCSTFVLEAGGLLSSLKSSLILFLEAGDDFVIEGDTFGRSFISSRPRHRRFSEEVTSHICPNKIYYTPILLLFQLFEISMLCRGRGGGVTLTSQSLLGGCMSTWIS